MRHLKFLATVFVATGMLFFASCNSGEKKETETTGDTSTVKTETTPVITPAPSGPKSIMTIRHKVANYEKWKPAYDAHDSTRHANGLHSYIIARGTEDSNMVLVAMIMDDVAKARELGTSQGLKDRMKKAGVTGPVSIDYLEALYNDTTALQQAVRLIVKHKVKDFDAWKKVFDSHKQARIDAGLTDRVLAHTAGDNKQVSLVFAVSDVAKAKEFSTSQSLKDKMAEAGVDGPPTFFFYKVVAKY